MLLTVVFYNSQLHLISQYRYVVTFHGLLLDTLTQRRLPGIVRCTITHVSGCGPVLRGFSAGYSVPKPPGKRDLASLLGSHPLLYAGGLGSMFTKYGTVPKHNFRCLIAVIKLNVVTVCCRFVSSIFLSFSFHISKYQ
jgi:hypothetical protein